ncbi:hypothetical protein BGZ63DRAFT_383179 [Mariannaea sp. PMI_226]|nr:hypothetical protein BGZ63DRAFT_383179 [Mariannaea sp. PMI_226]
MSSSAIAAVAASSSSSTRQRPPTSPPPSIASPSTTPALAHALAQNIPSSSSSSSAPPPPAAPLQSTLPSAETQRHVAQARAAVVATMENMMDSELQWRASTLHSNAAALGKQAKDVRRATEGLRRESDKLAREADVAARRIKELGNVQNWAEVLERDFLVLEDTVRLANRSGSCSCSCSDCGGMSSGGSVASDDEEDNRDPMDVDDEGRGHQDDPLGKKLEHESQGDSSKTRAEAVEMNIDTIQNSVTGTWSEASRSLTDPESSTGRGAKGSDTASTMS